MSTDVALPGVAYAEANWGRWIARCPAGLCTNAMQLHRWQQHFACAGAGGCGWTTDVLWPADPEAVEALLALRPAARTRNWLPGETLQQLLLENAQHDVLPPSLLLESGSLLDTLGERMTGGRLICALPEYRRREIGVT